ncbi:MAG: hypothetical protein KKB31_05035 [Nanoarchaeota archaeon]|nr:hypothetical protein [Nanoarchaeota archaeon]
MNKIRYLEIGIILCLVIVIAFILSPSMTGNIVATYDELTTKLVCKQQAYEDIEYYTEEVPYEDKEEYIEVVSGKNCDSKSGCWCIHKSWLGLGPCDSCKCREERTVTKYRTETKSRTVTKLMDVCIKLRKWQSPNYNENWLTYPEIYSKSGELIVHTD